MADKADGKEGLDGTQGAGKDGRIEMSERRLKGGRKKRRT